MTLCPSRYAAVLALSAACGCGGYVGPAALVPTDSGKVAYGATAGYRVYPGSTRGFFCGAGASVALREGPERPWTAWGDAQVGYGQQPVPYLSRWGFELSAGPAAGVLPEPDHPWSVGWASQLGVPYRISTTHRPWELSEHALLFSTLTPSLQMAQLIPVGSGHEHRLANILVVSLTYRLNSLLLSEP
jgi:hypothetical protein